MRETGIIKFFGKNTRNKTINFGFIKRKDSSEIYVNKNQICYTIAELAERLGVEEEIAEKEKSSYDFSKWSSSKDPEKIEWEYSPDSKNFYPISLPEGLRVAFAVEINFQKSKDEAKSVRLLLNTKYIAQQLESLSLQVIDSSSLHLPLVSKPKNSDSVEISVRLPSVKRVSSTHFLYCLYLEGMDKIYWGMTSNLTQRIRQHNSGEVKSTCEGGRLWILYILPFRTREEAAKAEDEAWYKSDFGVMKKYTSRLIMPRYEFSGCAGTVNRMDLAYKHLLILGWNATKIRLRDFLKNSSRYLEYWDNLDKNIDTKNSLKLQIDNDEQTSIQTIFTTQDHLTTIQDTALKLAKNTNQYKTKWLLCYVCFHHRQNELIFEFIEKTIIEVIFELMKSTQLLDLINTAHINILSLVSILHIEAYETEEELKKNCNFDILSLPDIYGYLLNKGWNGRIIKLNNIISAFSEINNIQARALGYYCHNERLKFLQRFIISPHRHHEGSFSSQNTATVGRVLSTSPNINWRNIIFPQEWVDIYEEYEYRQQQRKQHLKEKMCLETLRRKELKNEDLEFDTII